MNETRVIWFIDIEILLYLGRHRFINDFIDERARFFRIDYFVAISVNDFALHVHHVVEIERAFADQVIALLYPLLRGFDRFV